MHHFTLLLFAAFRVSLMDCGAGDCGALPLPSTSRVPISLIPSVRPEVKRCAAHQRLRHCAVAPGMIR